MIYSRYSIDALIIPTSTCWVHGPQPKVCSRDKIQYKWQLFHVPWPIKSNHLCSEYWGKRMKVSRGAYLAVSSHPVPRMTLKESPDPPATSVCFSILSLTNSLQLLSKQQIHLYTITNVNTFRVMRILEASAGLCLWQHWLAELARGITQHAPDSGEGSWHHCDLGYFLPGKVLAEKFWGAGGSLEQLIWVGKGRQDLRQQVYFSLKKK